MSTKRIPEHLRARIRELRAEGKSYKQIHEITGVAKSTSARICGIKLGTAARKRKRIQDESMVFQDPDTSVPATWCVGCRTKVYHPCVACRARRYKETKNLGPNSP